MAPKTGKQKRSANSSMEPQTDIAINTPSIPFDKPKKSKEKSDDEGNYKKIEVLIDPGNLNSKTNEKRYVYSEILIRHLKRGLSGALSSRKSFVIIHSRLANTKRQWRSHYLRAVQGTNFSKRC